MVFSVRSQVRSHSTGRDLGSPMCANDGVAKAKHAGTEPGGNRIGQASGDHRIVAGPATWIDMEAPISRRWRQCE